MTIALSPGSRFIEHDNKQTLLKKANTFSIRVCYAICLSVGLIACRQPHQTDNRIISTDFPHLEHRGQARQLMVNGQPFLILGGELHNSSATSAAYLKPLMARLDTMNLNTVLAAVTWELSEPKEGQFDFSLVDSVISAAQKHRLKVVILWFGSWKNGLSHYVPGWVKSDPARFPLMRISGDKPVEAVSPFSVNAMKADAKAFAALMKHIKAVDDQQTVIMIQVENEAGLLGDSRDRGPLAEAAYKLQVPAALINSLNENKDLLLPETQALWEANGYKTSGTWSEVFGDSRQAEEAFMAWHYASYINTIAMAGKKEYPLPMFVNSWLVQPEDAGPGDYPSGGPQAHSHDIWRAGAPAIDLLTPDIYVDDFEGTIKLYNRHRNTLFVPESKADENGAANAFLLIGGYKGIGYSLFGIENRVQDPVYGPIPIAYHILQQLAPEILEAQTTGTINAVSLTKYRAEQVIDMNGYHLNIRIRTNRTNTEIHDNGYGLIISTGKDEFIVAGKNLQINFYSAAQPSDYIGFESIEEGEYRNGKWQAGRRLNGDDIMLNYHLADEAAEHRAGSVLRTLGNSPQILKVKLYRFK